MSKEERAWAATIHRSSAICLIARTLMVDAAADDAELQVRACVCMCGCACACMCLLCVRAHARKCARTSHSLPKQFFHSPPLPRTT